MQYVLGNMLNGGGGLNPDGLSLDLQFAADKTLTARRGPTPTFTRSSGDNGGTTYFGPLVDFDEATAFSTTGIANGRASWFKSYEGTDITISYTGTRWSVVTVDNGDVVTFLAAPGGEWRPDQADWSGEAFSVTTSSTFGIVKAANNEPRFDHDPVTLACKGLLIEESRQNLFSSTNLNDWTAMRVTKAAITGIGLTNQATTLTISETGSTYLFRGATLTTGVAYAISVRVKAGTVASCGFGDLVDAKYSRSFNLSTNQWAASGGAPEFTNYTVTPNIDGWFLVSAIYTPTGVTGGKNIAFFIYGTAVGQTASFDTPQIEAGSFPTSYIPTTTSSLTRSADVCSITGDNFNNFYNQSEGTLFADVSGLMTDVLGGNRGFVLITDGTYANAFGILKSANIGFIRAEGNTGNVAQFSLTNAYAPFTQYKVALGVKTNDTNAAFNGSLKTTDTSVTLPSTMNRLEFRDATGAAGGQPSCHLAAIRYYKKRLPNAKLQALTV